MGMAASLMISVSADIQAATKQMADLSKQMQGVSQAVKGADDSLKKVVAGAGQVSGALGDTTAAAGRYVDAAGRLREANGRFVKTSGEAADAAGRAGSSFRTLVSADLAASAIQAAAGAMLDVAKSSLKLAGDLEQSKVAFTTMLGSAQKADAFLKQLATFAANTPFELKGLQDSSKKLLAFGFDSRDIIPIMTSLGNAVAGLGGGEAEINRVTMALGQMSAKGKVSAEEMMQLAELGIPAWDILAKEIGVSVPEAMKKAEKGAIPAAKAIEALVNGMSERFPNMMANQSKTLLGAWSNLQDGLSQTLTNIGTEIIETFNLTPIISNVAAAVGAFGREIEASGIVGALNKAFSPELKAAIVGVGVALTAAMVPALGTAAAALGAWVIAAAPFIATAAAIAFAVQPIIKNWDALVQEFQAIFNGIAVMAGDLYGAFKTVFGKVGELVQGMLKFLADKLKPVWDVLPEGIKKAIGSVGTTMAQLPGVVVPTIRNMAGTVGKATLSMSQTAFSPLFDAVNGTKAFFADMTKAIPTMTQGMSGKVALHMKATAGAISSETDKAAKAAQKNAEHIAKVMETIPKALKGFDITEAMITGNTTVFKEKTGAIKKAIEDLIKRGLDPLDPRIKRLTAIWLKLADAESKAAERAMEFEQGAKAVQGFTKRLEVFTGLKAKLTDVSATFKYTGDAVEMNQDKANAYEEAIKSLIKQGVDPLNPMLQTLRGNLAAISQATEEAKRIESLNKTFADVSASIQAVDAKAAFWGSSFDVGTEKAKVLESAINKLLAEGFKPTSEAVQDLREQLDRVKTPQAKVAEWMKGLHTNTSAVLDSINGLKDGIGTFAEELGISMEGPVTGAIEKFSKLSLAAFQIGTSLVGLWPHLTAFAGILTSSVLPAIGSIVTAVGASLVPMLTGMGAAVVAAVPAMVAWATTLWTTVVPATISWAAATIAATWPILAVAAAIGAVIAVGVALVQNWDTVSAKMTEIWGAISAGCRSAFEGLGSFVGGVFDAISSSIKSNINTLIGAMNFLIGGLNSIKIQVPSWVPKIGGMGWGGMNLPTIPMLEMGALTTGPTFAMIGEGAHQEAVLPLSPSVFAQLAGGIVAALPTPSYAGGAGGGNTTIFNLEVNVSGRMSERDADETAEQLVRAMRRKGLKF